MKRMFLVLVFVLILVFSTNSVNAHERDGKELAPAEEECLQKYIIYVTALNVFSPAYAEAYRSIMSSGRYSSCEVWNFIEKRSKENKDIKK
jgi:hypothetical protein